MKFKTILIIQVLQGDYSFAKDTGIQNNQIIPMQTNRIETKPMKTSLQ